MLDPGVDPAPLSNHETEPGHAAEIAVDLEDLPTAVEQVGVRVRHHVVDRGLRARGVPQARPRAAVPRAGPSAAIRPGALFEELAFGGRELGSFRERELIA